MAKFDSPFDDIRRDELYEDVQTRPVYIPKLSLPERDMEPLVPIAAGSLQHEIQEQANESVLRQALFISAAKNKFNNSLFDRMCKMVVELADIESRKSRLPDEELCDKAAKIVTMLFASLEADSDRSLERFLSAGQMDKVMEALRTYDQLIEDIQNFYHGGRGTRTRGYRDDRDRGRNDRDRGRREPVRGGRGWDGGRGGDDRQRTRQGYNPTNRRDDDSDVHGRAGRVEPAAAKANDTKAPAKAAPPVKLKNLMQQSSESLQDGYLGRNAYPVIYILDRQAAYWVKRDQEYISTVMSITDVEEKKVDYKRHATDALLISRTADIRDADPNHEAAKDALERLRQAERVDAMLKRLESQSTENPESGSAIKEGKQVNLILNGYLPAIQEEDYWAPAQQRLVDKGIDIDIDDAVIAYKSVTIGQWGVSDPKTGIILKAVTQCRNWSELKAMLIALRYPTLPIYCWEMLHTAITNHVNFYVNVVLNTDVSIRSFVDDLDSLIKEIEQETDAVQELFDKGAGDVAAAVANFCRTDVLSEVQGEPWDNDNHCLVTIDNVILLPVTTTDIALACASEIGVVSDQTLPWLYDALKSVLLELANGHPVRYTKLVTSDGGVYYVVPNQLYDGFVITNHSDFTA